MAEGEMKSDCQYDYEFSVWPDERGWEKPIYDVFQMYPRVCLTMTEADFHGFRDALERSGFTLRETSRVPHYDPETIL
jgi:hypothetical protein